MPNRLRKISEKNFAIGGALICLLLISMTVLQVSTAAAQQLPSGPQSRKPNILIIMTDDQPINMTGYEGNQSVKTPNLDALAKAGVIFDRMYVPIGLCAPVRASFITGLWPHRHGLMRNWTRWNISSDIAFLPKILRDDGYDTAIIGKCHFGKACHDPDLNVEAVTDGDDSVNYRDIGFDYASIITRVVSNYYGFEHIDAAGIAHDVQGKYVTNYTTDLAIDYLRQRTPSSPFFLWLAYNAPHQPWVETNLPPEFKDKPQNIPALALAPPAKENLEQKSLWQQKLSWHTEFIKKPDQAAKSRQISAAMIQNLDQNIGRIVSALRDSDQLNNTIIVFVSDNGVFFGEHQLLSKGPYGYDQQVRVPAFIYFPKRLKGNHRVAVPVLTMDILPTTMDLAGITNLEKNDAWSFAAALLRNDWKTYRDHIAFEFFSMSGGDSDSTMLRAIVTDRWKWVHFFPGKNETVILDRAQDELYDLSSDPGELRNLFIDRDNRWLTYEEALSDASLGPILRDLRRQKARTMAEGDDPIRPRMYDIRENAHIGADGKGQLDVFWQTSAMSVAELRLRPHQCQTCDWTSADTNSSSNRHAMTIQHLPPDQSYDVEVYAYDDQGNGDFRHWVLTP